MVNENIVFLGEKTALLEEDIIVTPVNQRRRQHLLSSRLAELNEDLSNDNQSIS